MITASSPLLRTWLPALLCIVLLATAATRVSLIPRHVHNIGFSEPNIVDGVQRILSGTPLYGDPEAPPYDIMQYAPLHYYACAVLCVLTGTHADDVQAIYIASRTVSLLTNLLTLWLLWRLGRRLALPAWSRLLWITVLFTAMHEPYFSRPDGLYLFCCIGLFTTTIRALEEPATERRMMLYAALWSTVAIFTKQSAVGPLGATGLALLLQRRWAATGWFVLFTGMACLGALGVVVLANGWHNSYANIVLGNVNGFSMPWFLIVPPEVFSGLAFWITPVALMLGVINVRTKGRPVDKYLLTGSIVTWVWAFITGMKNGSNVNYLTEHYILSIPIILLWVRDAGDQLRTTQLVLITGLVVVLMARCASIVKTFAFSPYVPDDVAGYYGDIEAAEIIRAHGLAPGDGVFVMGQSSYLEQIFQQQAWLKQTDIIGLSKEALPLDYSAVFDAQRNDRLRYVISADPNEPLGYREHPLTGFVPSFEAGKYTVYVRAR